MATVAATLASLAIWPGAAGATNIPVTTTGDVSAEDDLCSLREAIQAAQTNTAIEPGGSGADCAAGASGQTDFVQLAAATYAIAGAGNENANASGDFDLNFTGDTQGFLVIDGVLGAGEVPSTIIDAGDVDRIFDVQNGGTSILEIKELILRNGKPPEASSHGGAILVRDDDSQFDLTTARIENSDALGWGGGLSVNGGSAVGQDIDVTQVEFSGNDAVDDGGAIWADGPEDVGAFQVRRSAFVGNHTDQMGGALYIKSDGDSAPPDPVVELYNSTLSGNTADVDGGAIAFAFGLGGTLYTEWTTITGNSTPAAGKAGGIATQPAVDEFIQGAGMIMSGNTAAGAPTNCVPEVPTEFSGGASIESGPTACFPGATIADPKLAPLSYNATGDQTTRTHGLYDNSPALNLLAAASCGVATNAQGVDQRGVGRPIGSGCDAGAFEGSVGAEPAVTPPATPAAPAPAKKKCKKKKKKKGKSGAAAAKKKKKKGCKKKKK